MLSVFKTVLMHRGKFTYAIRDNSFTSFVCCSVDGNILSCLARGNNVNEWVNRAARGRRRPERKTKAYRWVSVEPPIWRQLSGFFFLPSKRIKSRGKLNSRHGANYRTCITCKILPQASQSFQKLKLPLTITNSFICK